MFVYKQILDSDTRNLKNCWNTMNDMIIGYTGFVGQTLVKQRIFNGFYNSKNVDEIVGKTFDVMVCSAAPAQKWLANKEPLNDLSNIEQLISNLKKVKCKKIILISTVDVFKAPNGANENTIVDESGLHSYGLHRRHLEKFVESHFVDYLIVRLPGLVGPGLKKNVIYDFLNDNEINNIHSKGVFQFYPMVNLWHDIQVALDNNLKLVHLTSEPISVESIANEAFNFKFKNELDFEPGYYDFQSIHSSLYGSRSEKYQYSKPEVMLAIRAFAQSEHKSK